MYRVHEYEYKGNKIVKYAPNDYIGFYFANPDDQDDIHQVRGTSLKEVQKKLDKEITKTF